MSSLVISCMRYRDCDAAIKWLCDTFGFEEQGVFRDDNGKVMHAQLRLGDGMIMLGPLADTEYGKMIKQPDSIGGYSTQSIYLVVRDADAVYARVKKNGGKIAIEIRNQDYGGRDFSCKDPEGHLWSVGTYDPWTTS
jgi:uncharacterized glyoxalase superfamily protein PhnB